MKIALIIERMDTARGGRETSTAQIAAGLVRRGQEVTVLCQSGQACCDGVEVVTLRSDRFARAARLADFVADVERSVRRRAFDVVHAMCPMPSASVYQPRGGSMPAQRRARLRRAARPVRPFLRLAGPLNLFRRRMAALERRVVGDPGVLCLAVSEMVARELETFYGRTEGVRVVYNAADVPQVSADRRAGWRRQVRADLAVDDSGVVFVTVANNFALKGAVETIGAFARWFAEHRAGGDGRLVIVGRERPSRYERLARRCGVAGQVVFVPHSDEIFRWYAAADACVLLSWYDPCSRVVLEATRWGVPSITTVFNGAAEALAAGGGVVVGSPRDQRAVVRAMGELADPAARAVRAAACRKEADRLAVDRHVDELLSAYSQWRQR